MAHTTVYLASCLSVWLWCSDKYSHGLLHLLLSYCFKITTGFPLALDLKKISVVITRSIHFEFLSRSLNRRAFYVKSFPEHAFLSRSRDEYDIHY